MRLTIVVPVYNVESTLERCLDSIVSQKVDDMQVVMVDDGSTDSSAAIAARYVTRHPAMTLVRQANGGLSAARNTGIAHATGDYVTFVDSDDYLCPGTLKPLLQILEAHPEVDMLEYSMLTDGDNPERTHRLQDKVYTSARDYWIGGKAFLHTYACNKLFRHSLFFKPTATGDCRFPEGKVFEDMWFLPTVLQQNPTVMTTSLGHYFYSWNPRGITATAGGEQLRQLLEAQLRAARMMGMRFMDDSCTKVPDEETPFYSYILNNQIVVNSLTGELPILPSRTVSLRNVKGLAMTAKALCLDLFGIKTLCKIVDSLRFDRQQSIVNSQ